MCCPLAPRTMSAPAFPATGLCPRTARRERDFDSLYLVQMGGGDIDGARPRRGKPPAQPSDGMTMQKTSSGPHTGLLDGGAQICAPPSGGETLTIFSGGTRIQRPSFFTS